MISQSHTSLGLWHPAPLPDNDDAVPRVDSISDPPRITAAFVFTNKKVPLKSERRMGLPHGLLHFCRPSRVARLRGSRDGLVGTTKEHPCWRRP